MATTRIPPPRHRGRDAVVAADDDFDADDADIRASRAELFSIGQLEQHARHLAAWHRLSTRKRPGPDRLLPRLAHNERVFARAYALITEAVGRGRRITPAAEWFIDNWPLLEEQIRTARLHLPRGYSRELPRLTTTTASTTTGHTASTTASTTAAADAATPRVYQLAIELVSHSHGRIDADALRAFIAAYQSVTPLRLGELWAVPIMLRLALLEDLRRVVANITAGRRDRERARSWIKKMIDVPDDHREAVVLVLADLVREAPALSDAFVAELATRLQARGPTLAIAMSWLEQRLAERGESVTQVFQRASQSQAADQVSIGNSIGGLRFLSATDWQTFVEDLNVVDIALRADPAGIYARMDFATRDRYRHAVEAFARRSTVARHDERAVADVAVRLADEARARGAPSVQHHVGYWLIDDGERALADAVGFDVDLHEARRRFATRDALPIYTIGITALTLLLTAITVSAPARFGTAFVGGALIVVVPLLVLALSQLATAAVQWRVTRRMTPHVLPRLDFAAGIPASEATLVAVPCLLTDVAEIDDLVEALELRFLANRTAHLTFALVSDFKDAATAHVVGDDVLLARARAGIDRLNAAHAGTGGDDDGARLFFLLHRPRRFNAADDVWMGEERKRGKLEDLNRALRGARGRFDADSAADVDVLARSGIRSVIVLDSDTQLPRDAGRLLVATMAHPLNTPVYDEALGRVVRGYSILQPRVGVSMASTARSRFARLFAGEPGIDPYTRAVSDVYQDLFSQGSFVGKGIYDVDMVQRALAGRFPDNRVLSHDLLESAYARCGLVTDVMLIEEQPAAHGVDLSRRARWVRGDWQIASWLLPRVPAGTDVDKRHPLSALSRWKVADNLRRSIVPAALLALLVIGWCSALPIAVALTIAVLAVVFVPGSFSTLTALVRRPEQVAFSRYAPDVLRELGRQLVRDGLALAWLPIDAVLGLDSMIRALVRLTITHRLLLEWRTAADAGRAAQRSVGGAYRALWTAPFIAVAIAVVVVVQQPSSVPLAAPVLLLWLLGPLLSSWLSVPTTTASSALSADDVRWLRGVARRTWRFFAVFTTTADHDLVPDNFQEDPPRGIAHRTSPTNIGLGLTATLAAHDFGWIGLDDVVARCTRTLATLEELPRHRGHFYNWYDTQTLEPLLPLYVSTVDSGNLAGHLITLAAGLDAFVDGPGHRVMLLAGLRDTFALVERARVATPTIAAIDALLREAPRGVIDTHDVLVRLTAVVEVAHIGAADDDRNQHADADVWAVALREQVAAAVVEITTLHPWLTSLAWLTPKQRAVLDRSWSLAAIAAGAQRDALRALVDGDDANAGAGASTAVDVEIARAVDAGAARAVVLVDALRALATHARALSVMEAGFLYDKSRRLLSIGKNVVDGRIDQSFYDLLASEARLASYIAVARGQLAQEHWFSLGRSLTTSGNTPALLSWSGSMFEYLMPLLIMPTWPRTLLDETCRGVVKRQIAWGLDHDVPWGVSESGYAKTDAALNYQYRAFGVAGLGYKRGLADDVVVAPYATVMAMMVDPVAACANLRRLEHEGRLTSFGFYEAIDYTPARLPPGKTSVTVRSFMAHHQGMSLLSLAYALLDRPMQRRFLADPEMRATELLLQERVPKTLPIHPHPAEVSSRAGSTVVAAGARHHSTPHTPRPEVQLLSNGRYHVVVSGAGGGASRFGDLAVTRWREDPTRDAHGTFIYVKDVDSGDVWSAGHQPTLQPAKHYEAIFSSGRAELRRVDDDVETHVEIAVSPEDDVELRRVSFTNRGTRARTLQVTSYAEVVLAPAAADAAHQAFSNLFVQTELLREASAILATRRPRSGNEQPPTLLHLLSVHGRAATTTSFETNREAFVGRGRTTIDPRALEVERLGDSEGAVLDPIVAVRTTIAVPPGETVRLHLVTGVAATRAGAVGLVDKYRDRHVAERVLELSWTDNQVALRRLDTTDADVQLYERLASHVLYASAALRAPEAVLLKNRRGQSGLWGYGISGDLPIVLVRIGDLAEVGLVHHLLKAHAWWRLKGLIVDVVIWNEDPSGYRQVLQETIMGLVTAVGDGALVDVPGGVFVRRGDQISDEDKVLMQAAARLVVTDTAGPLAEQLEREPQRPLPPIVFPSRPRRASIPAITTTSGSTTRATPRPSNLRSDNGHGGFTADGHEYVITTSTRSPTPAPWVNVIANPWFGTVVSERGSAYTWCENAHGNRLTPWSNDPVSDGSGEHCWLRDEEDGNVWSPTPQPAPDDAPYTTRHGFGYSVFEHVGGDGIASSLSTYVATDAPLKFIVVTLKNESGRARRVSLTTCFDLVLGAQRAANAPHIGTSVDVKSGALLASNPWNSDFAARVAFLDCSESVRAVSGDRAEVLGRNGDPARPATLLRERLSGRVGGGLDPCLAMQVVVALAPGEEREVVFTFGSGRDRDDAITLIHRFRGTAAARTALEQVWNSWNRTLGAVNVQTPDAGLDALANGWLLYQVLSSRLWARSGFYQSGGAFGFRDQLQDAMALVHAEPALLREQILRCASRQFREGDVQHWWHPPQGRGVRTRISDDYLWLPLATARYVDALGDDGVLDEKVAFLEGRAVKAEEDSYYDLPMISGDVGTLYEHGVRAIEHGLRFGAHGLPLMGTGDWNDGMNLVGDHGRGESVWLGMFLVEVLRRFAPLARRRGDVAFADRCDQQATTLRDNIVTQAWDGDWYKRAWFDDGTPLGAQTSNECTIDSLPQSWAVLADIGPPERRQQALAAAEARLVRRDLGVIQLFDPPFDGAGPEPGYIRGYVPGVRENGGQYTHAAVWMVMAFAEAGEIEKAWDLFDLINPIRHGDSAAAIATYKIEPYVVAADVYTNPDHAGRGGWSWYTGSASWMYRLVIESLLGVRLAVDRLHLTPKLRAAWPELRVHYRHHDTVHHIHVQRRGVGDTVTRVVCDGVEQADRSIPLQRDRREHHVEVELG